MSLSDITEKIVSDAEKKAERIISASNKHKKDVEKLTQERIADMEKKENDRLSRIAADHRRKLSAGIRHNVKLLIESKKRELIDSAFERAVSALNRYSEEDYIDLVVRLLKLLPDNLSGAKCIAPKDREKETRQSFKKAGLSIPIELTDRFAGGFVILADDMEFDMRFEHLLLSGKKNIESDVAGILFGE